MAQDIQKLEALSYGTNCIATGLCKQVISGVGATRTLTAKESGAHCLFDAAAGNIFTLPVIDANNIGMQFDFTTTVAVTSNAQKTKTGVSTQFLVGSVIMGDQTIATSGDVFEADGTSIVAISSAGSTTGGLLGSTYRVTAISLTQWSITGVLQGAGTLATPFATS